MKPVPELSRDRAPVLKVATQRLRQLALAARAGDFLGSEQELGELLGVSRPTFRQAVRVLEQDQLLVKRMGPHGGCYAARPDVRTTARAAALYLQVEQASLRDLMEVTDALQQCLLALACDSEEVNKKNVLRAFLAALSEQGAPEDLARFLELERTFERLVLDVAGNPALRLFLQIAGKFVDENPASQALIANPAMRRLRCAAWARMGEAILVGNTAACLEISRQQSAAFVALVPDQALAASAVGAERAAATDWHG